jgi:hypothetical protein
VHETEEGEPIREVAWQQFLTATTNEDRRQCQLVCLKAQAGKALLLRVSDR